MLFVIVADSTSVTDNPFNDILHTHTHTHILTFNFNRKIRGKEGGGVIDFLSPN